MEKYSSELIFEKQLEVLEWEVFPLSTYEIYESGNGGRTIWASVREFLKKLRTMIREQIQKVREKIHKKMVEKKVKNDLENVKKLLRHPVVRGKDVKLAFYDVWKYEAILRQTVKELTVLTKAYVAKYGIVGNGLTVTNAYTNRCRKLIEKTEKRLRPLKEKKISVDALKVLDWIEQQEKKDNTEVFAFAEEYLDQIKEIEQTVAEMERKADQYAADTGMVRKPKDLLDTMKNASIFVKRNLDWIGAATIYAVARFGQLVTSDLGVKIEVQKKETEEPNRGSGSMLYNADRIKEYGTKKFREGRTTNKAGVVSDRALNTIQSMALGSTVTSLGKSIKSRRNSV